MKSHSNVDHPKHYNSHASGIWRAGDKGNEIEDLQKAIWYLNDEINRLQALQKKAT